MMHTRSTKFVALTAVISAALLLLWVMPALDMALVESATSRFGPFAIVLLVALGIVVSPIPSGVVAMAAGAFYGTFYGGVLTTAGAVLGAIIAFQIARWFGRGWLISSDSGVARVLTMHRSQNALTAVIFASRLIPFVSFDAVSYVAGVTPLRFWRFALATAAGTAPVCLAFASVGAQASNGRSDPILMVTLGGATLLLPLIMLAWRRFNTAAPA